MFWGSILTVDMQFNQPHAYVIQQWKKFVCPYPLYYLRKKIIQNKTRKTRNYPDYKRDDDYHRK
jgi:hypothetical protein